jgi:hypothetical protein
MIHLFYIFAMFAILFEIVCLANPWAIRSLKRTLEFLKGTKSETWPNIIRQFIAYQLLYYIWTLVGLLYTDQWLCFLIIILLSVTDGLIKKFSETILWIRLNAIICLTCLLYAVITKYHFS